MIFVIVFIFCLMIGSFLNVLIYRLPNNLNIAVPRSHCPNCKKMISWYQNIPLISFLVLRGRCANCKQKISYQYFIVELVSAIMGLFLFIRIDYLYDYLILNNRLLTFLIHYSVFSTFLVIALIDLKHMIIPDSLNIYLFLIFLVSSIFVKPYMFCILGFLIGLLFPLSVAYIFYLITRKEGMGGGDIKLYAVLGIYLGPLGITINLFLSCFIGALVGFIYLRFSKLGRNTPIPFGPFIVIAASFQIFFPDIFSKLILF